MKLFDKNKELILKILNAILLIWIVASLCISISNVVNLSIKENNIKYEDYKILYCDNDLDESDCKDSYKMEQLFNEQEHIAYKKSLIVSLSNAVIVSGVLILLNTSKKSTK